MGEAKRKRDKEKEKERLARMTPQEQAEEKQKQYAERMGEVINRFSNFAGWCLINEKVGLGLPKLIQELYTQLAVNHAAIQALTILVQSHIRVDADNVMGLCVDILEERLKQTEEQFKVTITAKDVIHEHGEDPPPDGNTTGTRIQ